MRNATLLFLIKKSGEKITDICLAMKKVDFGKGRWNGVGGKVEEGESIEAATKRETVEEVCVEVGEVKKVAELEFIFVRNPEWSQKVHVFTATEWQGEPIETEEMNPKWFKTEEIPFKEMWPSDMFWLPKVLNNEILKASYTMGDQNVILDQKVETVSSL